MATWHRSCTNKILPRQRKEVSGKSLPYHYSEALKQKADNDSRKLASDFDVLSARLDSAMYQQSKHVWMTLMAEQQ